MAQWQDLLRLDSALQGRVSQLYDERKFPREIRHYLCVFIESQNWDLAAVDENTASTCFYALLLCLDEQWNRSVQENNILQGPDFPGMKDYLLKHFGGEPLKLAVVLSECLKEEKKILASASEAQGWNSPAVDQKWRELDNKVNELKQKTAEVKKEMKSLEFLNENIDFIQKTWQSQVEQNIGLAQSQAVVEGECLKRTNRITQTKQMVLQQIVNILKLAQEVVLTLTDVELPEWKRRQQMACIGSPVDTCLDHLQKWFTTVAEVLLQVREQLQKLQDQNKKYNSTDDSGPMAEIENFTLSLFKNLLLNALVVEKQPIMSSLPHRPLILKTRVRFTVSVRFLANLPEFKCLLKVKPVFDMDVEEAKTVKGFRHFDFNSDDGKVLDVDTPHGGLVAEFGHMSLKESKAKSKGSNEPEVTIFGQKGGFVEDMHCYTSILMDRSPCSHKSLTVTEELHIIKFVTVFQHAGLEFDIEASSLPVVVISSTNQVVSAWASVMWCNMLSTSEPRNLSLFIDPPPLAWQQLSQVLSWQFLSVGQRELDEYQLSMLSDRIVDDPDGLVYWSKFSKNENAWIWIDGILDLIKKHLVDLWRDGFIMGFVSRERTRLLLQEKQAGTFLLRFSESSKDGAITFSWVEHSKGDTHVHAVEPYTKMELLNMSLPNIIYNYSLRAQKSMHSPLLYLYPDIPKDTAFGRYYNINHETSAPKKVVHPYVHRTLVPVSENPTPPPSPPGEMVIMDVDVDTRLEEHHQELFSDLLNLPELPDLMTYQDMASSQTNFVDLYNTF
ncbi:signal transducer and activator of transcription 1-alpha/beta-like isoform X1 [Epinephelus lanceolatus]|uniref:signal transducer and activator of transcription 1-alpha/beta-like isoform X2 n=1 Tax=Epinephelus lanceolatus TaxID=310571 RepID=UPI0014461FAB|nr:signal transducer and activator of transcription 1-alpha/beta-like isoform X2 [Epinephelus lanceolatus]